MKTMIKMTIALAAAMTAGSASAQDIKVGHLTYHTGEFGGFGEFFDAVTDMSLDVINADPPLGRKLVPIHQDIGTIGEARAARKLIDSDGIDILLNAAHNYMSYRDYMLDKQSSDKGPLMPSVHGGAIEAEFGGNASEPLFRGSPMDSAQGSAALLYAKESGSRGSFWSPPKPPVRSSRKTLPLVLPTSWESRFWTSSTFSQTSPTIVRLSRKFLASAQMP